MAVSIRPGYSAGLISIAITKVAGGLAVESEVQLRREDTNRTAVVRLQDVPDSLIPDIQRLVAEIERHAGLSFLDE